MNAPIINQLPPYSEEAERSVVGSCIIDSSAIMRVISEIDPSDFFIERNRWTYEAIISLYRSNRQIDFQTVNIQLANHRHLDEVGGPAFVMELVNSVPTALHAETYARIVKRKAIRRKMLESASDLARMAYDEEGDEYEQLSKARSEIADIVMPLNHTELSSQVAARVYDQAVEAFENPVSPDEVRGLSTGLIDFDKLLGGITSKKLIIIAGRPGMNKSTLACQVAFMLAQKSAARCAIFSLEMNNEEVTRRQYSRLTGIPHESIENGTISDIDLSKLLEAETTLHQYPVVVNDVSSPTVGQIESVVLRNGPFDLVVVDHLGLMSEIQSCRPSDMVHVVGRVTRSFKNIAKDYNTCVMLVSQLSRSLEVRQDKRPILSDLRDSGRIEEDADEVYMLYRDDYYNPDSDMPNILEIIRRKGRSKAQRRACDLYFDGPTISLKNAVHRTVEL